MEILNATHRHGELHTVAGKYGNFSAWVVYPVRSEKAAVVVVAAQDQKMTDWLRAVADQVSAEGYISIVPDVLAMDVDIEAARLYALTLPAANGKSLEIAFEDSASGMSAGVSVTLPSSKEKTHISLAGGNWSNVVEFLNHQTGNVTPTVDMSMHGHAQMVTPAVGTPRMIGGQFMGAEPRDAGAPQRPRGYPVAKLDELPAGLFTARSTLLNSTIRSEWVDIPTPGIGQGRLHTWISYPATNVPAGIVVLMQHGPGMDEWMRSVADQLARQGYIALSPDLQTGLAPNGGNYESFGGPDAILRTNGQLKDTNASYQSVRAYGLKIPGANGKSASLGFCRGGRSSYEFASTVPGLNAAVVYYGAGLPEQEMANIEAPVLAFFGEDDVGVTSTLAGTADTMKKLGKSFESYVYPHATHGFLEFQDLGGNASATSDSWARTTAFLKQHLQ